VVEQILACYTFCYHQAEGEVVVLTKRVRSLEEDLESTESRFLQTSTKLEEATQASDESERQELMCLFGN
jgi:hypothetical protein